MKKILALCVITSCASFLQAETSNTNLQQKRTQTQAQQTPTQGGGYSSYESNPTNSTQNKTYPGQAYQNGTPPQHTSSVINDQTLSSKIQNTLSGTKYSNITAKVDKGVVTLQGVVSLPEDKVSLGALIGGIDGVQSVNNLVTVQGNGASNYESQNSHNSPQGYNGLQNPQGYSSWPNRNNDGSTNSQSEYYQSPSSGTYQGSHTSPNSQNGMQEQDGAANRAQGTQNGYNSSRSN